MTTTILPDERELEGIVLGPETLTWRVASDVRGFLAPGYALLMQVAHPTVGAGVREHSDFQADPWGRLVRTLDYLNMTIYGGRDAADVGRRVRAMHRTIRGRRPDGEPYHALEPTAFAWVFATLGEAIVKAHQHFGRRLTDAQVERFYAEFRPLGRLVGVRMADLPEGWADFRAYFDTMVAQQLDHNDSVGDVLHALNRPAPPPIPGIKRLWPLLRLPPAAVLRTTSVGLLPPRLRERFGVPWTARDERRLRAIGALSRPLTPLLPARLRVFGPQYLRMRRRAIARGDFGPAGGDAGGASGATAAASAA